MSILGIPIVPTFSPHATDGGWIAIVATAVLFLGLFVGVLATAIVRARRAQAERREPAELPRAA